jgi:hypothetical protein
MVQLELNMKIQKCFGDPVQMQYKKPLPDEGAPNPAAEFEVSESGPIGRASRSR